MNESITIIRILPLYVIRGLLVGSPLFIILRIIIFFKSLDKYLLA
jgi:hypothetical protein